MLLPGQSAVFLSICVSILYRAPVYEVFLFGREPLGIADRGNHCPVNHAVMFEVGDLARVEIIHVALLPDYPDELGKELRVFVPPEHILVRPGLRIGLGEDPRG